MLIEAGGDGGDEQPPGCLVPPNPTDLDVLGRAAGGPVQEGVAVARLRVLDAL
jgi:hypothetical protein